MCGCYYIIIITVCFVLIVILITCFRICAYHMACFRVVFPIWLLTLRVAVPGARPSSFLRRDLPMCHHVYHVSGVELVKTPSEKWILQNFRVFLWDFVWDLVPSQYFSWCVDDFVVLILFLRCSRLRGASFSSLRRLKLGHFKAHRSLRRFNCNNYPSCFVGFSLCNSHFSSFFCRCHTFKAFNGSSKSHLRQ